MEKGEGAPEAHSCPANNLVNEKQEGTGHEGINLDWHPEGEAPAESLLPPLNGENIGFQLWL